MNNSATTTKSTSTICNWEGVNCVMSACMCFNKEERVGF